MERGLQREALEERLMRDVDALLGEFELIHTNDIHIYILMIHIYTY